MTTHDDVLKELDLLLQQLVSNAKQLYKASKQAITEEILAPLQTKQEELIDAIIRTDSYLEENREKNAYDSPLWAGIQDKLKTFQNLNNSFIENLGVRKELINFEIKDTKKRKLQLSQLKTVYGKKTSRKKTKSRINTLQ